MTLPAVYTGHRRAWLAAVVAAGLVQAGSAVGLAVLMQRTLDGVLAGTPAFDLPALVGTLGALALAGGLARWSERYLAERLGQDYVHELRLALFAALARTTPEARSAEGRGTVPLRFMTDLNAVRQWISMGQARLLVGGVLVAATLGYLATVRPASAALVLGIVSLAAGASLWLAGRLEATIDTARDRRARLANLVADRTANLAAVIGFGRVRSESQQLERHSRELGAAQAQRAFWVGGLRGTTELSIRLAMGAVLVIGLRDLAAGGSTAGTVLASVSLVALLAAPLRDLSRVQEYWTAARVSRRKLAAVLAVAAGPGTRRDRAISERHGVLQLEAVALRPDHRPFSTALEPGARVVVIGANGSGKTHLLWTLAGIRRPAAGRVRIDGKPAHRLDRDSVQRSVGIASPDLPLLKGSLRMNLRYRAPRATDAELEAVCRALGLVDRLGPWPGLLDLRLHDGGANLSSGERTRVQLARAMVGNPGILLLDELDAHLDPDGRRVFRQVLASYPGTVVFTSHDPLTTQLAGTVWSLDVDGINGIGRGHVAATPATGALS